MPTTPLNPLIPVILTERKTMQVRGEVMTTMVIIYMTRQILTARQRFVAMGSSKPASNVMTAILSPAIAVMRAAG
jgi:hypothetical protein